MIGHMSSSLALLALARSSLAQTAYNITQPTSTDGKLSDSPFTKDGFNNAHVVLSKGGHAICVGGIVSIQASATNAKISLAEPGSVADATQDILSLTIPGSTFGNQIVTGTAPVSGTFNVSSRLCVPVSKPNITTVHVLTHGIGFDKTYWDFATQYSYVDAAAEAGYATFLYDRLGTGHSDHLDAIQTVQAPLEVALLAQLTAKVRSGALAGLKFRKAVVVGHSFGSVVTAGALAAVPTLADAAVLTGFSSNTSSVGAFTQALNLDIANHADPYQFGNLSGGYLVAGDARALQTAFFSAPEFDPKIVARAYAEGQTLTLGEAVTQFAVLRRTNYTAPVAVVNGDKDLAFCGGNCTYQVNKPEQTLVQLFPQSKNATTYLAPNTGHGLSLHYTADAAYQFIFKFLASNGLAA